MKRADVMVMGGAMVAASGALVLLDTAVTSVPEPPLAQATGGIAGGTGAGIRVAVGAGDDQRGVRERGQAGAAAAGQMGGDAAASCRRSGRSSGDGNAPVVSTVLVRLHGHRVDAAMLVQVNPPDATSNWGLARGCERQDFYYAQVRYSSDHDGACSYVTYVTPWTASAPTVDDAWRLSMQEAVDNGWDVPQQWLAAVYRVTDPVDALQVRYLFDPAQGEPLQKEITARRGRASGGVERGVVAGGPDPVSVVA